MSRHDQNHKPREVARDAAAAWHVRLASDEAVEADWLNFEAWLAQSPENARAYDAVEALWAELGEVELPLTATAARPAVSFAGIGPSSAAPAGRRSSPATGRRWSPPQAREAGGCAPRRHAARTWGAAIAASLAAVVGLGLMLRDPAQTVVYATAKGEQREVALADGTRLRLNSGSRLSVRLGRSERRVELMDGEAAFEVTHDATRPFVVVAGDRAIRDVGTAFDVLRHAGRMEVAVERGIVEIRPEGGADSVRLSQGQGISRREGAPGPDVVRPVDAEAAFAWTKGRLVYRDRPLAEVAADLNRYLPTPIEVAPEARDLRLTAVLSLDREDAMVAMLAAFLPVTPVRQPGAVKLELRQAGR